MTEQQKNQQKMEEQEDDDIEKELAYLLGWIEIYAYLTIIHYYNICLVFTL
jgi:hypothetical protein